MKGGCAPAGTRTVMLAAPLRNAHPDALLTGSFALPFRVATRVDESVLAVSSCLLRPGSSYILLSLVPSAAAACSRAAPGEPLELHDLEHCSDYDAALLRLDGGACTGLCAAAGGDGAVLAGFCGGDAGAAKASIVALADALALNLHEAATPLAANIKRLLLAPPAKQARGEEAAAEQPPHAAADCAPPAGGAAQDPRRGAAEAERSESSMTSVPELAERDPSSCRREGERAAKRDSFDQCGAAPVLQDPDPDTGPDPDPSAGRPPASGAGEGAGRLGASDRPAGGDAAGSWDALGSKEGGKGARARAAAGEAEGWDSALPAFQKPKLERAFLAWRGGQLRPVRGLHAATLPPSPASFLQARLEPVEKRRSMTGGLGLPVTGALDVRRIPSALLCC